MGWKDNGQRVQLSWNVKNALAAYRKTINAENMLRDAIKQYPGDVMIDAQEIIEMDGTPFIVAFHPSGSHIISLERCGDYYDPWATYKSIQSNYGTQIISWWLWDGTARNDGKLELITDVEAAINDYYINR